jgi:hypothetical protein
MSIISGKPSQHLQNRGKVEPPAAYDYSHSPPNLQNNGQSSRTELNWPLDSRRYRTRSLSPLNTRSQDPHVSIANRTRELEDDIILINDDPQKLEGANTDGLVSRLSLPVREKSIWDALRRGMPWNKNADPSSTSPTRIAAINEDYGSAQPAQLPTLQDLGRNDIQTRVPWKFSTAGIGGRAHTAAPSSSRRISTPMKVGVGGRAQTAAPSSSRHISTPMTVMSLSYRQLLQQRLQKYQWSATFQVESDGPMDNARWSGAFRIGEVTIGVSDWEGTKDMAIEAAAQSALGWLNQYGYH